MSEKSIFKIHKLEPKTLVWWKSKREKIDFEPSYQRKGRRWSVSDKQYLIDSIINGFDIPKFYVADFVFFSSKLNEKKTSYAVIDGKQRFEAIFDFFEDKFPLSSSFELLENKEINLAGKKYSDLKSDYPDVAEDFDNFSPDVVGVITDNKNFIEELFVRLNRGKPLSGAELRNAISSPTAEMIRIIGSHSFFSDVVKFSTNKGENLNSAAKILMFEHNGIQETKKSNLDKFVQSNQYSAKEIEFSTSNVLKTLDLMVKTFRFKDDLLASEGHIPIYYLLMRNSSEEKALYIRDFIEFFQDQLKKTSDGYINNELCDMNELLIYKNLSRSINDKNSNITRYEILESSFDKWIEYQEKYKLI